MKLDAKQLPFFAAVAALAVAFVYLQVVRAVEPLALDQGLFACFASWPGELPYRDIFDTKPPLFLYTWTLGYGLGGSAASMWWFEAVWLAATMGLMFALAARLWGRWAGLLAAGFLFFGLWTPRFGGYWSRAQAEELMILPTLGAAWFALSAREKPRAAVWAGVLTGVVGLYKIPGMAVAGAWLALWLASLPLRDVARRTAWFAAGLGAPWILIVVWFGANGALGDFVEAVFVTQRHYAEAISPPWSYVLREFPRMMWGALPGMIIAAAIGLGLAWRKDRAQAAWLTTWVGLTIAAVLAQRQLAEYHYLLTVPGLALAGSFGVSELARGLPRGQIALRGAAAVGLVFVMGLGVKQGWAYRGYADDASHALGNMNRTAYLRTFEKGLFSPRIEEDAARYLRARTKPSDGILVWGLSPGIYALSGRHPVTRYPFHKLLLTDAPMSRKIPGLDGRRAEFLRRLAADPPVYILIGTRDRNPFEPMESIASLLSWPAFKAFVDASYLKEQQLGRFLVLRRQPATPN